MQMIEFAMKGIGLALLAGILGVAVVGGVEVIRAYLDPARREGISHRTWRENLRQMLH